MTKGYDFVDGKIMMNRELNELDVFLRDFLDVIKKYFDYLVVSGFVSISSGRTRGTEDIDVLFYLKDKENFKQFFEELKEKEFWVYQGDTFKEVYSYLEHMTSIRIARKDQIFPNIELIPINETRKAKFFEFSNPQKIRIKDFEFKIPPLEFEILYKELVLKGEKDMGDALHLRTFFRDILNEEVFRKCKKVILEDKNEASKR